MRHCALAAASEYANTLGVCTPVFDRLIGAREESLQLFRDLGATARGAECDCSHVGALVVEKSIDLFEAEFFREERIVADLWVAVEREVCPIDGEVAVEGSSYLKGVRASKRSGWRPKKAVVADEEIDALSDGPLKWELARVDCGTNFFNDAVIFDLQAIVGAVEILDFCLAGALIAKSDDFLEYSHARIVSGEWRGVKCFLCGRFGFLSPDF